MSALVVRAALATDADLLSQWAQAMAWETEHKRLDPATVDRGIALALADAGKARYFIADRDGRAAGTLMLTAEWSDWRCADWWWIQSVYVDPGQRRSGVFAALYRHVATLAATTPAVCGLRLYVEKDNVAAQRTYESLGMRDARYCMYEAAMTPR